MGLEKTKFWEVLKVYPEKCTGCRLCEMVCSLKNEEIIYPDEANIRIASDELKSYPVTCSQCLKAPCEESCRKKAIYRSGSGYLKVDKWGCNQCGLCIGACPFGMIRMGSDSVIKCDLCDGSPECVAICPTGAIGLLKRFEMNLDYE